MATPAWPAPTTSVSTFSIDISGSSSGIPGFSAHATDLGKSKFVIDGQKSFIDEQFELGMFGDILDPFAIDINLVAIAD